MMAVGQRGVPVDRRVQPWIDVCEWITHDVRRGVGDPGTWNTRKRRKGRRTTRRVSFECSVWSGELNLELTCGDHAGATASLAISASGTSRRSAMLRYAALIKR